MKTRNSWIAFIFLLSGGIGFFLFPSCEKIKEATQVKVNYDLPNKSFNVDSVAHLKTEQVLYFQSFTANVDSVVKANKGSLKKVTYSRLRLSIVTPTGVTLNWLSSARITITPQGGSPIEVATSTDINSVARSIDFSLKNLDIASNISGPFVVTIYGNLSKPIPVKIIQMVLESSMELSISPF